MWRFPDAIEPYIDVYFRRTREILHAEGLNPWVRAQVFIRHGPGTVGGIAESAALIDRFSEIRAVGGRIFGLRDGSRYSSLETVLVIEAPVQEIVNLETAYLGIIAAETTKRTDGVATVDLDGVERTVREIVGLTGGRPVNYFGARHRRYDEDAAIAQAAFKGGASGASTDIGAACVGKKGQGTIPHILENIFAFKYGVERAVVEATRAFDRVISMEIPRIALIDYANREVDDAVGVFEALGDRLFGIRIDTCGENAPQGGVDALGGEGEAEWRSHGLPLPADRHPDLPYWIGKGVTVTGVYAVKRALTRRGGERLHTVLTSGFGDRRKVRAFIEAEQILGVSLFDSLGVGGIYSPSRITTMDVVGVGDSSETIRPLSKVGRHYRPNARLERLL
ncbi:MAG: hypothetical protein RL417_826 [Pseudomonadota bacterium]